MIHSDKPSSIKITEKREENSDFYSDEEFF